MNWINILKCPVTNQDIRLVNSEELNNLNKGISENEIWQIDGTAFDKKLDVALTTNDGTYIYPIVNGIVILLSDLALTRSKNLTGKLTHDADKLLVRNFYNEKGWFTNDEGDYEDAVIYEDLRDVSKDYLKKCHDRVSRYLNQSGEYMLDAASGALQFDDYLQYSENYKYRVCVDFSFQALTEARKKLGDKGIYVLADMTNMPFKDNVMDGFVSLNTIYHIPKDQQVQAIRELYRLLAKNGKGVVVYDWFKHSRWMNVAMLPFRGFVFVKNRVLDAFGKLLRRNGAERRLYFYSHTLKYFREHLPQFKLVVWRSLSVHFMRYYVHDSLGGKKFLKWVYEEEEKNPEKCGRLGEYPMFIFEK